MINGEAIAWGTVASFLRGELDHNDEATRTWIAEAAVFLDYRAHRQLNAGRHDDVDTWDEHLRYVSTEER